MKNIIATIALAAIRSGCSDSDKIQVKHPIGDYTIVYEHDTYLESYCDGKLTDVGFITIKEFANNEIAIVENFSDDGLDCINKDPETLKTFRESGSEDGFKLLSEFI